MLTRPGFQLRPQNIWPFGVLPSAKTESCSFPCHRSWADKLLDDPEDLAAVRRATDMNESTDFFTACEILSGMILGGAIARKTRTRVPTREESRGRAL